MLQQRLLAEYNFQSLLNDRFCFVSGKNLVQRFFEQVALQSYESAPMLFFGSLPCPVPHFAVLLFQQLFPVPVPLVVSLLGLGAGAALRFPNRCFFLCPQVSLALVTSVKPNQAH
ncbi:MAG TPA: hypothetical protein VJ964_09760 [Balneolaceae bacterium]|nr:hypothetical protein [Balneolaceae bacterium]